ncbi:hypothetical protein [Clostridium cellulovorans]|uniref:Uncharacterized protein n=1 Tax=Clostridium cellulovorans (strain ATCC 35296 / DSM 3052 / OCM 3 / 743B) TaxID=573061 RepID=D9SSI6_CLOC7|nr:hypothetical protein [Clostridium cellulovorans]ADL50583.1 hypothetical protein Clocel_0813 [Clostridium cellulovorans 743B]
MQFDIYIKCVIVLVITLLMCLIGVIGFKVIATLNIDSLVSVFLVTGALGIIVFSLLMGVYFERFYRFESYTVNKENISVDEIKNTLINNNMIYDEKTDSFYTKKNINKWIAGNNTKVICNGNVEIVTGPHYIINMVKKNLNE